MNGKFPNSFASLKKLKGIGDYTAAAIASFSYNEITPVVDGNVYRVLSRVFNIAIPIDSSQGKKLFYELAGELISKENPGEFNQSIMEFGALQCTPVKPNCTDCVLSEKCLALSNNTITERPVKAKKTKMMGKKGAKKLKESDKPKAAGSPRGTFGVKGKVANTLFLFIGFIIPTVHGF